MRSEFSKMKIYNGFCTTEDEALPEFPDGCEFFEKGNPFEEIANKISSLCKTNNTKMLKVVLSKHDTLLTDEAFTMVLDYIAKCDSSDIAQQIFEKLMKKDFSCSTIRPYLQKLDLKETVRVLSMAVKQLSQTHDDFDNYLDLTSTLINCHRNKLLWSNQFSAEISDNIELLKTMRTLCIKMQSIEENLKTLESMPCLLDPAPSDYWVEKVCFKCRPFRIKSSEN